MRYYCYCGCCWCAKSGFLHHEDAEKNKEEDDETDTMLDFKNTKLKSKCSEHKDIQRNANVYLKTTGRVRIASEVERRGDRLSSFVDLRLLLELKEKNIDKGMEEKSSRQLSKSKPGGAVAFAQ